MSVNKQSPCEEREHWRKGWLNANPSAYVTAQLQVLGALNMTWVCLLDWAVSSIYILNFISASRLRTVLDLWDVSRMTFLGKKKESIVLIIIS